MAQASSSRVTVALASATAAVAAVIVAIVVVGVTSRGFDPNAQEITTVFVAAALLACVILVGIFARRLRFQTRPALAWAVGGISVLASLVPWFVLTRGLGDLGSAIYTGLRVPRGQVQFWDLSLVLQSVDCARQGFDVYAVDNGCLQDPSIYAPGMTWLGVVPFGVFSNATVQFWGVVLILALSFALLWLARGSDGPGQVVLLIAAVGAPWLLLLERGNIDGVVLIVAVLVAILARRWNTIAAWSIAAVLIWLMGTWKYYPFVLGLMLIPALRLRRGWIVLAGFLAGAVAFTLLTLGNLQASARANEDMVVYVDFVILGRIPLEARMAAWDPIASAGIVATLLVWLLAIVAVLWGASLARVRASVPLVPSMLATAGGALYLSSVLVAGFGWAYKAAFLLLIVPLAASGTRHRMAAVAMPSIVMLVLIAVTSVIVWNTLVATTFGIVAAGLGLGSGLWGLLRLLRVPSSSPAEAAPSGEAVAHPG